MPKILIVCSRYPTREHPYHNVFIKEQVDAVRDVDKDFDFNIFQINRNYRQSNYLLAIQKLRVLARQRKYDLLHAHYGLSGLTCIWQKVLPVVVTFHGSDISVRYSRLYADLVLKYVTDFRIYVNVQHWRMMHEFENSAVLPCGVDLNVFYPINKEQARAELGWSGRTRYVIFPSEFDRVEKNSDTAIEVINALHKEDVELIELKGYTRLEVNRVLNAADLLLMTSLSEGSPQVVKEAMACNLPIVSTDVGDVKSIIENTQGCFLTSFAVADIVRATEAALAYEGRTNGREKIERFDNRSVARKLISIYQQVLNDQA
jgi:teichuronic acid biosynthesis glycosyltransferase TuaC